MICVLSGVGALLSVTVMMGFKQILRRDGFSMRLLCHALVVMAWCVFAPAAIAADTLQIEAPSVFLLDYDTGTVLLEKNADALSSPASTAKVMTAELVFQALKQGKITLDTKFLVSEHAWRTGGAMARGSAMFAVLNSEVRVEDLLHGLLVDSGNDAAIALAEGLAGSEEAFASLMNQRAQELGLTHLSFTNPWGRDDPKQRVSARDMVLLARHIITTYPEYYKYFGDKEFTWNKIRQLNRNPLIGLEPGVDGLKTGYIDAASGYGIVASSQINGHRLILALYGAKTAKDRVDDARKLLNWGFHAFDLVTFFNAGDTIGSVSVLGGAASRVKVKAKVPVQVLLPRGADDKINGHLVYQGPLKAPIEPDTPAGDLVITRNGTEIFKIPVYTNEAIETGSLWHQAFDIAMNKLGSAVRDAIATKLKSPLAKSQAEAAQATPTAPAPQAGGSAKSKP